MPNLLLAFKQFLLNLKLSTVSRKLYLSDTRHFLNWLGSEPTLRELSSAKSYSGYLSHLRSHATAPSMLKRTVASLRQFGDFLSLTYSLPNPMSNLSSTSNLQAANCELRTEQYIKHFTNYLNAEHLSPLTIKSYKSDITRYFDWINTHVASNRIEEVLKGKNIELYLNHLSDSATVLPSTIERKLKSLDRFQVWYANIYSQTHASDNQAIQQNSVLSKFRSFSAPHTELAEAVGEIGTSAIPDMTRFFVKKLNYRTVAFMAILLLFTSTLAIFGYRQFSRDVRLTAAYPSTPVTPGRVLSFQGRLEDENGTPITGPTDITFKLWNHLTDDTEVSCDGGGDENCLYSTDVCSIDPDDDGVFSTQIGASCGTSIDPTVFTENTGVWLEVKVDTETLSPRQPIASVAYALNSETIQGFPISSTVSAIRNTVVPMNEFGEIIVGEQSPRLTGVSGTFQISAPSLSFITTTGTNGSISLAPDGTGQINMYGNTTSTNFLNISNAQLTTGSLITGTVGNDNSGFKLLDFLSGSSPTSVFSVAANGNITTAVGLTIGSTALSSTGNPSGASLIGTFDEFDNSDSTTVQAVLNDLDANLTTALTTDDWSTSLGSIYPNNSTFDLLIGGQASSSAKFAVLNVNSGTPVASVSAGTAGAVYLSAAGSLATTAKQSLTLGSSDTGNIILAPGGVIALTGIAANLTAAGNLDVAGTLFAGTADAFQISATGIITTLTDETINGIDITAGTISDVVNLTINAGGDLTIGTIGLNDIGTDNITSGASLIGTFDEFDNSDSTTIQAVLNDLDAAIGYVSSLNDDWSVGLGSLYPKNSTLDLLVGGQATSSAKFAVLNIDTGTPTASVSAGVAGAAYLTATGNLATTAMQTLTLGGASTGNILLNSGNIGFASSAYLNWGSTYGEGGYGFRDNAGTMEYKNSTGDWAGIGSGSGSGGSNWRIDSGALSPLNDTLDLLVGNIATASAKFAVNASSGDVTLTGDLIGGTGSIINFPNFDVDTSGNVSLADQADLRLLESSGGGTNYTGFQAPATLAANYLYTMPSAFPVSATGYFLTSSDTGTLSWTDTLAASSVLFSGIGSGTNTSAAMVVGTGASLAYTGSGTIAATTLLGGTWAIPGAIGSDTANSGAFTTLAATGDLTFTQTTPRIYFGDSSTDEDDYTINVDASSFNIKNNSDSSRIDLLFSGDGSVEIGNNNNAKTVTIAGGTGADTINIGTGGTSADTINIGGYATTTTNFNGVVNFANGSTYFVDNAGNAKFLDFIAADTGNPGVTIGDGATGFTKIGSATLGDNNTAYFHFDTDSNTSDEIRIYDNGSLWSNTGVLTSGVADGATAIAYTLNTINALSTPGSKLLSLQNQGTEKFYIDANGNLYTSGTILSGNGQGMLMTNKSGGTVAARSLVVLDTTTDSSFTTTTTPYAKTSYGIVTGVGLGVTNDANGNGACDTNDICMVAVGGEIEVKLTNAATAAKGDYVFTGDTAGSGVASAKQFDGLIGMVSNVAGAGSGYVKMIFKVQPQVTAAASIDKGSKHNEYWLYADKYAAVGAGSDTDANLLNRGLTFDTFTDTTKTDSANTTVSGPVQMSADTSRVGLLGGQTMATSTTDNAGNTYLGSNTVNDTYYYDRTKDSAPQVQVELGIDPNWYNGVTLSVATTSAELSQSEVITAKNPNLSTTYNGSLLKVTGTDSAPRSIYLTVKSPTTFDWTNYAGDAATAVTMTPGTAQALGDTGVSVTFTSTSYNVGDVFKIASWFIEGSGATRGSKQQFPERSYVIATASGVSIIDADTQKLWMRFSQHADGYMIGVDTANDPSATQGLNGKVYVSENGA
ncbi:MAG: phage integrase N-terminal SAM-like domain-containing protein, partial [bacterium]